MKAIKIVFLMMIFVAATQFSYAQCCSRGEKSSEVKFSTTETSENSVKTALKDVKGIKSVALCTASNTVTVAYDDKKTSSSEIKQVLNAKGIECNNTSQCSKAKKKTPKNT